MDFDSYDEDIPAQFINAGQGLQSPAWWCRIEAHRLSELLRTHVALALETKTHPRRVRLMLMRVRAAVLDVRTEGES